MLRNTVRSLWAEPPAPDPPVRVWRDWVLVAVLVPTAILEGLLRDDVVWRPVSLVLGVALAATLPWRRTHPLLTVVAAFGALIVLNIASLVSDGDGVAGLNTMVFVVLLPYALARWGAGREVLLGLPVILVALVLGTAADYTGVAETLAGSVFLLFPATLGAAVRYQAAARMRELDQVKLHEREQLARELHDTVAHHVSAIAISAQAGRTLAAAHPEAAVDALELIEKEASRTLTEMRLMVGAMRGGGEPALAPQRGVADIPGLARTSGDSPQVAVRLAGDLDDLRPSLGAALYRLTQESVTNAVRHARHATRIDVEVVGDSDVVRLRVADDGDAGPAGRSSRGYGLVGMTERVALLGGTLEAGPAPGQGWTVTAVLPRAGTAR